MGVYYPFIPPPRLQSLPYIAKLLHGHYAIYAPPQAPLLDAIYHTILVMAISCKGQRAMRTCQAEEMPCGANRLSLYLSIYLSIYLSQYHKSIVQITRIYIHVYMYMYMYICIYIYMLLETILESLAAEDDRPASALCS